MTQISGDVMQRIRAALESTGMSTSVTLVTNGITVELDRLNSPYKSHQSAEYSYDYTDSGVDSNVLYATNCRRNRVVVCPRDYMDEEKVAKILQPDDSEEIAHGVVPKVFAEALLGKAYEHFRFTALSSHNLIEAWVIRKRLARWTDTGKPIYVGEEPVEVEEEIEV